MTPESVLIELLERVAVRQDGTALISGSELNEWPAEAVKALILHKLIVKARPAISAECPGCERECLMPVHTVLDNSGNSDTFIVCDKRSDINRIPISPEQLTQWRCSTDSVCDFIAKHLELRRSKNQKNGTNLWEIGVAKGLKRSQMLCLQVNDGLLLVAGNNSIPLAEYICYQDGEGYSLDNHMIGQLVDASTTPDARYTPSTIRQENRKLNTQSMYESWQKEYRKLQKTSPKMSNTWYSKQIAKLDIAQGRDFNTIKKNMTK